ncbi:hypothetical protein Daus18300_005747 [Diaporthe australafricana]|uniref:Chromo domain-containing protein n=1 Tax=Diaporthe australafricana TaxID=127596 RepID=A0ABR3WZ02_9PEZI
MSHQLSLDQPSAVEATADPEAGWEQFRSDLRVSRMAISKENPIIQFQIPIRSQPPKYTRGSGPPPPRISLRLVHDSNAFIIDKAVLPQGPFLSDDSTRQRRCYYIIGWPDLPAARPVVDASKILDYVSPRTLEDWEYQDALRRVKEREEESEEQERADAKGKAVIRRGPGAGVQLGARRKPGRPRRAMMVAQSSPEPELNSEQEEMLQRRMSGPSLSTPQKSRLAQLVAEEEILEDPEEADEDAQSAIHRQLESDSLDEVVFDGDVNMGVLEDLDLLRLSSAVPGISGGESSRASSAKPASSNPPSSLARTAADMATHDGSGSTFQRPPAKDRSNQSNSASASRSSQVPVRPLNISTTPVPLPSYLKAMKQRPSMPNSLAKTVVSSSSPTLPGGYGQALASTPTISQPCPTKGEGSSLSVDRSLSHENGFTPIGGTFPRPPKRPAEEFPPFAGVPARAKLKKGKKKKQVELPHAQPGISAETEASGDQELDLVQGKQDYVVKRLEGDYILDGVHWFKVRWEGEWPESQNPTWEPKENIAGKLVKEYLKRKARREANQLVSKNSNNKKSKSRRTSSLADWAKGYSSVAEAFEGHAGLNATNDAMLGMGHGEDGALDADDDGHDELLVVDAESEVAVRERKRTMDAQIAAQFASIARGAPRHF